MVGYLFPGFCHTSDGPQQDLESGKLSQAWANAEELKTQYPTYEKRNETGDHHRVFAKFLEWRLEEDIAADNGALREFIILYTA